MLLLGAGAVVLLLPFVQEQTWKGDLKWLLIPLALLLLAAFVLWDLRYSRRGCEPLVDFELFNRRSYSVGISMISVYFAGFTPLFFVFTLYLQIGQKYSALLAGLAITPFALGSAVAAGIGGRIVHRLGRRLIAAGLAMVGIGFAGTLLAVHLQPAHDTGWATLLPLLVAGFGSGLVIAPNQTLTLSEVPVERAGTAGGLLQTGQRIGTAIGIAAVGAAFFARLASAHGDYATAYERGLLVALAFVVAALLAALFDLVLDRTKRSIPEPAGLR